MNKRFLIIAGLILFVSLSRLLTNYLAIWNFTPIVAMALFAGASFKDKKFSFIIPISAMLITDFALGFMPGMTGFHTDMIFVYGTIVLITFIGMWLQNRQKMQNIVAASLLSSIVFFIVTNFAVWFSVPIYSQNISGLIDCYIAAIPFFGNSVAGDLFFCGVLFGGFALLKNRIPELAKA